MSDGSARPISAEQLIALNDELRALARCGVPLESGLRAMGRESSGRVAQLSEELGRRLEQGMSLGEALRQTPSLPPAYAAILQAGVQCGQLVQVLDGVTLALRRSVRVRNAFRTALLYPVVVAALAFALLILTLEFVTPLSVGAVEQSGMRLGLFSIHRFLTATLPYWAVGVPVLAVLAALLLLWRSPLSRRARGGSFSGGLVWRSRLATFAELLPLLMRRGLPMPEALRLSAAAAGHAELDRFANELANHLQDDGPRPRVPAGFPPVLAWQLQAIGEQANLMNALEVEAASLRRRVDRQERWLTRFVPSFVALGLGAVAVAAYGYISLAPWFGFFYRYAVLEVIP